MLAVSAVLRTAATPLALLGSCQPTGWLAFGCARNMFRRRLPHPAELRVLETDFLNKAIVCWPFQQCCALPLLPSLCSGPASQQVGWRSAARETCFADACLTQLSYGCWKLNF